LSIELEKALPEAVIVSALRTPIGTARKGTLRDTSTFDLAHHLVGAAAVVIEVLAP
jgi:acetyl-CoA C-acetyltransferase